MEIELLLVDLVLEIDRRSLLGFNYGCITGIWFMMISLEVLEHLQKVSWFLFRFCCTTLKASLF